MNALSRDEAWALLAEWTEGESLRKHALAVEAAVRGYAGTFGENDADWGVVALLHDFDYERYPTPADHPFRGCEELRRRGYPEWVTRAILSHANYSGVPRESLLERTGPHAPGWSPSTARRQVHSRGGPGPGPPGRAIRIGAAARG
jgi:predicted hydrolase (HD superfamily)